MKKIKKVRKWKFLKEAIANNLIVDKELVGRGLMTAYAFVWLFSWTGPIVNSLKSAYVMYNYYKEERDFENSDSYDEYNSTMSENVVCADLRIKTDENYKLIDRILYDKDLNKVDLTNSEKDVLFAHNTANETTLDEMNLQSSKTKEVVFAQLSLTDDFVNYLPNTVETLTLTSCNYITDLSLLPSKCPNIKVLVIDKVNHLESLDFIYDLKNLESIRLNDSLLVTTDLLEYCQDNNILVEVNGREMENKAQIEAIIDKVIEPDMNDSEVIRAVCDYVIESIEYDIGVSEDSNLNPIDVALNEGEGVCISYAELTASILNKLDIETYPVIGGSHAWDLVLLNDKYYYIDPTSIESMPLFKALYKYLGISPFYMSNPNHTWLSSMKSAGSDDAIIPESLVEVIIKSDEGKNMIQKYGPTVACGMLYLLEMLASALGVIGLGVTKDNLVDIFWFIIDVMDTYNNIKNDEYKLIKR